MKHHIWLSSQSQLAFKSARTTWEKDRHWLSNQRHILCDCFSVLLFVLKEIRIWGKFLLPPMTDSLVIALMQGAVTLEDREEGHSRVTLDLCKPSNLLKLSCNMRKCGNHCGPSQWWRIDKMSPWRHSYFPDWLYCTKKTEKFSTYCKIFSAYTEVDKVMMDS